jgi:hypothetical protein
VLRFIKHGRDHCFGLMHCNALARKCVVYSYA